MSASSAFRFLKLYPSSHLTRISIIYRFSRTLSITAHFTLYKERFMALLFYSASPEALLKKFNDAIEKKNEKGGITTWEKKTKNSEVLYTHLAPNWSGKASFFVSTNSKEGWIRFGIRCEKYDPDVYAYYHGHLMETFLRHFPESFTMVKATAKPQKAAPKSP